MVVDRAACAVVKAQPVTRLVADILEGFDRGERELAGVHLHSSSRQFKAVIKALKGVRIMKVHFPGQKRKATIKGLCQLPASAVGLTVNNT